MLHEARHGFGADATAPAQRPLVAAADGGRPVAHHDSARGGAGDRIRRSVRLHDLLKGTLSMKLHALLLFLTAACNAAPDRPLDRPADRTDRPQPYAQSYVKPDLIAMCLAGESECGAGIDTPCCDGTFCSAELFV